MVVHEGSMLNCSLLCLQNALNWMITHTTDNT
jgi:hypothetical protein